MKKWPVVALVIFFVTIAFSVIAAAPDAGSTGPRSPAALRGPGDAQGRFGSYLNLSQEQRDKMRELRNRYYTDTHDLRYDVLQKRLELRKLFTDPKVDDATLLAKQKELSALRQKLIDRRAQMMIEWRKILTPEQIQKLDRMPMAPGMGHRWRGFGSGMMRNHSGPGAY